MGRMAYAPVLDLQNKYVEELKAGAENERLILVEHDPVYTMGRSAKEENVLTRSFDKSEITVIKTTRGGDVTYHGFGQLVGYPILNLRERKIGVSDYIANLEEVLISTISSFGIRGGRDLRNRGVWVGNDKIAAIGVRVTRGIAMHGFALNVCVDLSAYDSIVPCGIHGAGVTSMDKFVSGIKIKAVKPVLEKEFNMLFGSKKR